ncbi:MAG: hypothetical protein JXL80_14765, partial [Planctomycetes bacterium]|nr:hypothetical protein [Planctomycetota bacterium]
MARKSRAAEPSDAKEPKQRADASPQCDGLVCNVRGQGITAAQLNAAADSDSRYQALPRIVRSIVATCHKLPEINHLDSTLLPESDVIIRIVDVAREVFFPGYFGDKTFGPNNVAYHIGDRLHALYLMLAEQIYRSVRHKCRRDEGECPHCRGLAEANAQEVLRRIPAIRQLLALDVRAAFAGDPAAKEFSEIILSYPG